MSQQPRLVVLDDRDPRIVWSGNDWFLDNGGRDPYGSFGRTYLGTEHTTRVNGSLSFSFAGTGVWVFGSIAQKKIDNNTYDPVWDCYIDNAKFVPGSNFEFPENNWQLCSTDKLDEGNHVLTLNVTNNGSGNSFYVDYVEYRPTQEDDLTLDNAVRLVNGGDRTFFNFSSTGWQVSDALAKTQTQGASVQFNFHGTGFTWITQLISGSSIVPATLSYAIDGEAAKDVDIPTLRSENTTTHYAEVIFTTSRLSPGAHSCVVTYNGNSTTTPLVLDHIFLNSTLSSSSPPGSSDSHKSTPVGAIVGGVVGGLGLIALILLAILFWRKRQRSQRRKSNAISIESPTLVVPFSIPHPRQPVGEASKPLMPSYTRMDPDSGSSSSGPGPSLTDASTSTTVLPMRPLRKGGNESTRRREEEREVIHHHDSGLRLEQEGRRSPIEIPPRYSSS